MNIFIEPTGVYSRAMTRMAGALRAYAPRWARIVRNADDADLVVMYVIGPDAMIAGRNLLASGRQYVSVQCCYGLDNPHTDVGAWAQFWNEAAMVWSYYDLRKFAPRFFHSPLGIDREFRRNTVPQEKTLMATTTGYSTGPVAEAIEETWVALERAGRRGVHVGPAVVEGMNYYPDIWHSYEGVSDASLASIYARSHYVVSLRHIEGFELPAAEGLSCGARPILFDQPCTTGWYGESAIYIPECEGEELVARLVEIFNGPRQPVTDGERTAARARFDWASVAPLFWRALESALVGKEVCA